MVKDYKEKRALLSDSFREEVYQVVRQIPGGKVTTYGTIAALLGVPRNSRMVGRVLKEVPAALLLPCHRVVNASGRLVPGWEKQRQLLLSEGIILKNNECVNLKEYAWKVDELY